jgi:hypothetical protein
MCFEARRFDEQRLLLLLCRMRASSRRGQRASGGTRKTRGPRSVRGPQTTQRMTWLSHAHTRVAPGTVRTASVVFALLGFGASKRVMTWRSLCVGALHRMQESSGNRNGSSSTSPVVPSETHAVLGEPRPIFCRPTNQLSSSRSELRLNFPKADIRRCRSLRPRSHRAVSPSGQVMRCASPAYRTS